MSTNSFGHRRWSLPGVVLCVVLASACESPAVPTAPAPAPSPIPAPTPGSIQYSVSGIVMSAGGAPAAHANVMLQHSKGMLLTRTDANGAYAFSFHTNQRYQGRFQTAPGDFLGLLIVGDDKNLVDIRNGQWATVQLLPWGQPDVVHNVRLRPVRTLASGQSMLLSVEPDSSLAWDKEWDPWVFPSFDTLEEEFRVSVQTDGILTIDVSQSAGGNAAMLTCSYVGCPAWRVQGSLSIPVEARWSPFYFSVQIPRTTAPQRYEIQTSLR